MTYDRHNLPPELKGQAAPGFVDLDFSSPQDEVVAAETGVIPVGELSDAARAALSEVTTDAEVTYDASKDHPNQKGGFNRAAYERLTASQRAAVKSGIAKVREARNKQG